MQTDYRKLVDLCSRASGLVVAFSGGVDSSLLLAAAKDALADRALGVTARSPLGSVHEIERAVQIANDLGVRHLLVDIDELAVPEIQANDPERCYYCKAMRFAKLLEIAEAEDHSQLIEGSNTDDLKDYRPGFRAIEELGIRSPFLELGMDKQTIRHLARERGLSNWAQPAAACLASRVPYNSPLSIERLSRIDRAEKALADQGFVHLRVRDHKTVARIEVASQEIDKLLDPGLRSRIVEELKGLGYIHVSVDLAGYRMGALNEEIQVPDPSDDVPS